jgi:signal transduction histidine kinase
VRGSDLDSSGEPIGGSPVKRSLIATLDRVDQLVEEALNAVVVPAPAHERARGRAVELLDAASDPRYAEPILALAYSGEVVEAIAVDLAARPDETRRLFERLEALIGVGRITLARELLRAPLLSTLAPAISLEVETSLLAALSGARSVSVWTRSGRDDARSIASAGELGPDEVQARELAAALLGGSETGSIGTSTGVRLDERLDPPGAVIAVGRPLGTDQRLPVLRIAAPALEAVIDRVRAEPSRVPEETVISAVERRLARLRYDLHDGPQQDVHLLAADLALFRDQLLPIVRSDPNYERIVGRLDDLAAELVALDGDLRRLASAVQSPFLPPGSLPDSVRELGVAFTMRTGIDPDIQLDGDFSMLSESQQITLLALIREALSNVREHAGASRVKIAVSASAGGVSAEVVDDGRGFEPEATLVRAAREGHLGLVGMHERVRMLGGRTQIESRPGGPTVISARLPAWPGSAS